MSSSKSENSNFSEALKAGVDSLRTEFSPGEKVTGVVSIIDPKAVFLDIGARSEGMIDKEELLDEDGNVTVAEGDTLEAYFAGEDGDDLWLTTKMQGKVDDSKLQNAYNAGIPVEGRVKQEISGGFEVDVGGFRAFCPYSQIALRSGEAEAYIGEQFLFNIIEYEGQGRNIVLSRRELLEKEAEKQKEEAKENLNQGDVVKGTVTKTKDFGAFVDIGGIEGLIPISELAWERTEKTEDVVKEGEEIKVLIREIDWENDRISLSLRQAQADPWLNVTDNYPVGQRLSGTVTKLMPFGAFVQLEPGVEGLLHISKLGQGRHINHPQEVVKEQQEIDVLIEKIDTDERRISLTTPGQKDASEEEDEDVQQYVDNTDENELGSMQDELDKLGL